MILASKNHEYDDIYSTFSLAHQKKDQAQKMKILGQVPIRKVQKKTQRQNQAHSIQHLIMFQVKS